MTEWTIHVHGGTDQVFGGTVKEAYGTAPLDSELVPLGDSSDA
jgi:hypothetical protein